MAVRTQLFAWIYVSVCCAGTVHCGTAAPSHAIGIDNEAVDVILGSSASGVPFVHFWEKGVGSGHAGLTTRVDWRDHMKMAHDELGFTFVRYHAVFNDATMYFDAPLNKQRAHICGPQCFGPFLRLPTRSF